MVEPQPLAVYDVNTGEAPPGIEDTGPVAEWLREFPPRPRGGCGARRVTKTHP